MKKILISVDGIKDSKEILPLFQDLRWRPENIILLHVEQPVGAIPSEISGSAELSTLKESQKCTDNKEKLEKAETILDYYKKELIKNGCKNIRTLIREGHQSEKILKTAEEENVDLIILNCSGKTRLQRLASGCASKEVEETAKMPVFITKGDGCGGHAHIWNKREA